LHKGLEINTPSLSIYLLFDFCLLMQHNYEKKIKYRCSTIPTVSTTKKNHLSPQAIEHKKMMTFADGNPSPVLKQVLKCVRVKSVNT